MIATLGIDVGASSKGYHALALSGSTIAAKFHSCDPAEIARWCVAQGPVVIAIDAPCRWRKSGGPSRAAELAVAKDQISCFSTPTEEKARGHAFYTWMFAGHALYTALAEHYPVYDGSNRPLRVAIETFPQAVACALAGEIVSAKKKGVVRRELLERAGINTSSLRNIDELDAALCALAARSFAAGEFKAYGDVEGGFIIVPKRTDPAKAGTSDGASGQRALLDPAPQTRIPLMGTESTWASSVGLFLLNFGHLEYLVSTYLQDHLTPAEFQKVASRPFQERWGRMRDLLRGIEEKRLQVDGVETTLQSIRQMRNHLAHGYAVFRTDETGALAGLEILQAGDVAEMESSSTKRLSFAELSRELRALNQVIETITELAGFKCRTQMSNASSGAGETREPKLPLVGPLGFEPRTKGL